MNLKNKRFTKGFCIRFDLEKLKEPKLTEVFRAMMDGSLQPSAFLTAIVDTFASSLKEVLLLTAEEVPERQRKKIQLWVANEVLDLCNQKRQLKQQQYTSTEAGLEYRKVRGKKSQKEDEGSKERVG